jgi:uncharacterized protein YgiM (DUF1202 family)
MSNYYEGIPFGPKFGRARRKGRSLFPLLASLMLAFAILYFISQQADLLWTSAGEHSEAVPTPAPRAAAIVDATPVPTPVPPTPTPRPTATPALTPSPTPAQGPTVMQIANTGGLGVYMRRSPSSDERIRAWVEGTRMTVIGPDEAVGGATWRHVRDPLGNEGWVPAQYLTPAPATPDSTPTGTAR